MTPQVRRLVLSVIAMVGLLVVRRRPVRHPESTGNWQPADE